MKLRISPLLLLVFYPLGIHPKEAKAHIYTTAFSHLSVTQCLLLLAEVPKWFKVGASFSHLPARAQADTAVWMSAFMGLLIWKLAQCWGIGIVNHPWVHQLQMNQSKYLKYCSKLMTSPACHHPHRHRLFNSNFSISASMNQSFQKRTQRIHNHTKLSLIESENAPFSVYFPFPAIVLHSRYLRETSESFPMPLLH